MNIQNQILNRQISLQITGKYILDMEYPDLNSREQFVLGESENTFFVRPTFARAKEITKEEFNEILALSNESAIEVVRVSDAKTSLSYDEFWDKYYNSPDRKIV